MFGKEGVRKMGSGLASKTGNGLKAQDGQSRRTICQRGIIL
jgi:hypothetical protein